MPVETSQKLGEELAVTIESSSIDAPLRVTALQWKEQLARPFSGAITISSSNHAIDMSALLATPMTIRLDKPDCSPSYLHGFIDRMELVGTEQRLSTYQINLVSCISLLQYSGGCRIFQNQSTPDIVKQVFAERGYGGQLLDSLDTEYPEREYCVQYGESDLNFVSRLLEEEGIYYFFKYTNDSHELVLADDASAHASASGNELLSYRPWADSRDDEFLYGLKMINQYGTSSTTLSDYDFTKPSAGMSVVQLNPAGDSAPEMYHFPGNYSETENGERLASVKQQGVDARRSWGRVSSRYREIRCGNKFKMQDHDQDALNKDYLITASEISVRQGKGQANTDSQFKFEAQLSIQDLTVNYRPEVMSKRPQIYGPQVAKVCGKVGEDIWTDEYGRVKVQFPWDRKGKCDEQSSCWLRVSQPWTGNNWGAMSVPRIGEEVVVQFIDGNPDRPLIIGRVYNAENMPPDALADAQAKTVFRTRSTKDGDQTCFHELSFDDTSGEELLYLHSERDFTRVVENNDVQEIGFDKSAPGDQSIKVYNDRTLQVGVGSGEGSLTVEIEQDRKVNILQGNDNLTVEAGDLSINAQDGNVSIEAANSIVLQCGESTITLKPSSIEINSPQITVEASGELQMQGTNSSLQADGQLELQGGLGSLSADGELTVQGAIVQIN